jgi:DNA-binding MarR family transcriptional regulator
VDILSKPETCNKAPAVLRDGFSWPLARLAQTFIAIQNEALAEHGLTMRSFAVLATVSERRARTQLEIAQIVGLDKSTLVSTIDELERRGLVERRPDPADRRARVVESTTAGQDLAAKATATVGQTESKILAFFEPADTARIQSAVVSLLTGALHDRATQPGSCL